MFCYGTQKHILYALPNMTVRYSVVQTIVLVNNYIKNVKKKKERKENLYYFIILKLIIITNNIRNNT